jgi:ketosteroid isomerase-like protein
MLTIGQPMAAPSGNMPVALRTVSRGEDVADAAEPACAATPEAMDTAALIRSVYRCYRERRLAELVELLSDDFQFRADLPDDPVDPMRPRSRAELTLIAHRFLEEYDILTFEPGPIRVDGDGASVSVHSVHRHKKTGKILDTTFQHDWRVSEGKMRELRQQHDLEQLRAFVRAIDGGESG